MAKGEKEMSKHKDGIINDDYDPPFFSGVQIFGWDIFRAFRDKNKEIIKLILVKDGIFHEYENVNWREKHIAGGTDID